MNKHSKHYWDRKVAGLCVDCGIPVEDCVRCPKHQRQHLDRNIRWRNRRILRAYQSSGRQRTNG